MNTRAYPWRTTFLCAVFETEPGNMPARISKASKAIEARLAEPAQLDDVERRAIEDARKGLATLSSEVVSVVADPKR